MLGFNFADWHFVCYQTFFCADKAVMLYVGTPVFCIVDPDPASGTG